MNMKFVTKLVLIPIEEWEKVKKHLPAKNILNTVEVDQAPQMKKEEIVQDNGTKTNGSEKEEETLFESYGSEEEECNFNN